MRVYDKEARERAARDFIRVALFFAVMVIAGMILMVALSKAEPLPFRGDQYIPPIVQPSQPKAGQMVEQIQCNCGPNTQTSGAPANPVPQGIHPR
jgi:cell division protein FtsN